MACSWDTHASGAGASHKVHLKGAIYAICIDRSAIEGASESYQRCSAAVVVVLRAIALMSVRHLPGAHTRACVMS